MATLKSRTAQIPGGLSYLQPETGWKPAPWSSFDSIVRQLMSHRLGNMYLARKNKWGLEYNQVAYDVDAYNAKVCEAHGWTEYLLNSNPEPPKMMPPHSLTNAAGFAGGVRNTVAAVRVLADWLGSGLKPVPQPLAEQRARTCLTCPKHVKEDDQTLFQKIGEAAAGTLKTLISIKKDLNLSTSLDKQLGSCGVCDCAMAVKVQVPVAHIRKSTSDETKAKLWEKCWILTEQ